MGAALFIVLDNSDPGFDPYITGRALSQNAERLHRLAAKHGLKGPMDYCSTSPEELAAFVEEESGEPIDESLPAEVWWSADEGIDWATRLRALVEENTNSVKSVHDVIEELNQINEVLTKAKAIGARWHFMVDC